jgi:DNA-binding MltR family transcriptional regulator
MAVVLDELAAALKEKYEIDLSDLFRDTHASTAMRIASIVEDALKDAIKFKLRADRKTVAKGLFKGKGKYATLEKKINGAHKLKLIDDTTRDDAHLMRLVRNEFGHEESRLHFDSDNIVELLSQMSTYEAAEHNQDAYLQASDNVMTQLEHAAKARLKRAEAKSPPARGF